MKSLRKSEAYVIGIVCVIGLFVFSVIMHATIDSIYGATLSAIVGLTLTYIGGNVVDNGVKGKFYNPNLDENKSQAKPG